MQQREEGGYFECHTVEEECNVCRLLTGSTQEVARVLSKVPKNWDERYGLHNSFQKPFVFYCNPEQEILFIK